MPGHFIQLMLRLPRSVRLLFGCLLGPQRTDRLRGRPGCRQRGSGAAGVGGRALLLLPCGHGIRAGLPQPDAETLHGMITRGQVTGDLQLPGDRGLGRCRPAFSGILSVHAVDKDLPSLVDGLAA